MKIYSNIITEKDVRGAFVSAQVHNHADIHIEDIRTWKPRDYACGVEVHAESFSGSKRTNRGDHRSRAASWDDWGYLIAHLYNLDPHARVGFYDNEADFVEKVRKYRHKESSLAFLDVLDNIREYGRNDEQRHQGLDAEDHRVQLER